MSPILKENQVLQHKRLIQAEPDQLEFSWKRVKTFPQSAFSMFPGMMSCSITRILWKLTNTWFQQFSYQILKANNSYSMFLSHHFQALCLSGKALLFGWGQTQEFSKMQKWAEGFVWLNSSVTQHASQFTSKHRHKPPPLPKFSFLFFNLSSLKQHLSTFLPLLVQANLSLYVTHWIQFVQSQRDEVGFNFTRGDLAERKTGRETGFKREPGNLAPTASIPHVEIQRSCEKELAEKRYFKSVRRRLKFSIKFFKVTEIWENLLSTRVKDEFMEKLHDDKQVWVWRFVFEIALSRIRIMTISMPHKAQYL